MAGLRDVFNLGREAVNGAGRALTQSNRSERATALGFGSDVAKVHSAAATRVNERARDQIQMVMDRLEEVRRGDDWPGNVARMRAGFQDRDGAKRLDDARADLRLAMLEDDPGLKASVAEFSLRILDNTLRVAAGGDLDQIADHLRKIMENAVKRILLAGDGTPAGRPRVVGGQSGRQWLPAAGARRTARQLLLAGRLSRLGMELLHRVPGCVHCHIRVRLGSGARLRARRASDCLRLRAWQWLLASAASSRSRHAAEAKTMASAELSRRVGKLAATKRSRR